MIAGISVVWFEDRKLKKDWCELRLPEGESFRERFVRECSQVYPMCENLGRGVNAELAWGLRSQQFALALNVGREKAQNVWVVLKTIKSDRDFLTCEQAFEYRDEVGMRKTYLLREPGSQYTVEVSGADKMFCDCLEY